MTKLLGLILVMAAACAEAPKASRLRPQDFRLRYLSAEEIQAAISAGEVEVRLEGRSIKRVRVAVSEEETVQTVLAKVLGENPVGDWYVSLVREKEIKTTLPWFEKGSAEGLAEAVLPGNIIVVHQVRER